MRSSWLGTLTLTLTLTLTSWTTAPLGEPLVTPHGEQSTLATGYPPYHPTAGGPLLGRGDNQRTVRRREEAAEGGGAARGDSQRTVRAVGGNQRAGDVSNGSSPPRPPRLLAQF